MKLNHQQLRHIRSRRLRINGGKEKPALGQKRGEQESPQNEAGTGKKPEVDLAGLSGFEDSQNVEMIKVYLWRQTWDNLRLRPSRSPIGVADRPGRKLPEESVFVKLRRFGNSRNVELTNLRRCKSENSDRTGA
jgi:hypothetical protein